ncbi:Cu/Zn superoxide dismutase [Mycobacterium rhizamassiliense]|jgi:Cu-Zn family superoxide dismutase|uniref:Cu/Zn superoxide dismutase n=1 Tax=Mycobacterium rhizamassiliense TaxID=1841860 RepID=A0A2U3NMR1_9MYCO|nr:superoxide dismutase family protein [Mycobacterium rhizamassiliense]SPM32734.1 Cu/Zn superoxide dismutase [Mycobacterium rhizamassiliense]
MNKGVSFAVAALTATIAPLAACSNQQGNQANTSTSPPPGAERLTTQLKGADGNQIGTATIDFANGYATVTVETSPNQVLSPGFHSLMVHAVGKCEAPDFTSAGSVYQAADHTGFPASGDLTALQVRNDGSAKLVTTTNLLTAADLRNSSGSALILHQSADNLNAAPTGESNKRVACGVIAATSSTSTTTTTNSVSTVTSTAVVPPPETSTSTVTVTPSTTTYLPTKTVTTPPSLPPGAH